MNLLLTLRLDKPLQILKMGFIRLVIAVSISILVFLLHQHRFAHLAMTELTLFAALQALQLFLETVFLTIRFSHFFGSAVFLAV